MTWRAFVVVSCMLGAGMIGLAAGLVWSPPVKSEAAMHAKLGSLKQCRMDLAQLTTWRSDERRAMAGGLLARFEEITAAQALDRAVKERRQDIAGLVR